MSKEPQLPVNHDRWRRAVSNPSGYADFLNEQLQNAGDALVSTEFTSPQINLPELVVLTHFPGQGLRRYLLQWDDKEHEWIASALAAADRFAQGTNKQYGDLALRQASRISPDAPKIYRAPEGGIVIENRSTGGNLTLIIEGGIGVMVRTADDLNIRATFELSPDSISELLTRYAVELKLLVNS